MEVVTLLFLLGTAGYVHADCYPGDTAYTSIIQSVYNGVTSGGFQLSGTDQLSGTINRQDLCIRLTSHHNSGTNSGMTQTNSQFLVNGAISESECRDALTYTQGYNSIAGWQQWDGSIVASGIIQSMEEIMMVPYGKLHLQSRVLHICMLNSQCDSILLGGLTTASPSISSLLESPVAMDGINLELG